MINAIKYLVVTSALFLAGCQSPFLVFPGGELSAPAGQADDFGFASGYPTLILEVKPDWQEEPYSVILRTTVIDGQLYIDAASARRWGRAMAVNPEVRVKLGDTVYPAKAQPVSDPAITARFLKGRTIYRLVPQGTD